MVSVENQQGAGATVAVAGEDPVDRVIGAQPVGEGLHEVGTPGSAPPARVLCRLAGNCGFRDQADRLMTQIYHHNGRCLMIEETDRLAQRLGHPDASR